MTERPMSAGPGADQPGDDDGYSATALGSHWFERPGSAEGTEERTDPAPVRDGLPADAPADRPGGAAATVPLPLPRTDRTGSPAPAGRTRGYTAGALPVTHEPAGAAPDRVEDGLLRFGPGVRAPAPVRPPEPGTLVAVWRGAAPGPARRGPRRYGLAAAVLLLVLAVLLWQRYGRPIEVEQIAVRAAAQSIGCGGTADVVAEIGTNGRPGTLVYRWIRSDGTVSGRLREELRRGQKQARVHLLWSIRGRGDFRAEAELRILSPTQHRAGTAFDYRCD
ncbi:hypothetical protein [Streptomyces sp. CAU 1734]|uniref:hypothetical protein n=1 Tax=Streptomyces sp. CAU 1734 TaxID=3140360 RepID=UPI00326103BC